MDEASASRGCTGKTKLFVVLDAEVVLGSVVEVAAVLGVPGIALLEDEGSGAIVPPPFYKEPIPIPQGQEFRENCFQI